MKTNVIISHLGKSLSTFTWLHTNGLPVTSLAHRLWMTSLNSSNTELIICTKYMQGSRELKIPFHTDKEAHILLIASHTFVGWYLSDIPCLQDTIIYYYPALIL